MHPVQTEMVTLLEDSLHRTPEEQQKWESLKKEFAEVLNNKALPAGKPPAGRPVHRIELVEGAAPSFIPRYRRPPQHGGRGQHPSDNSGTTDLHTFLHESPN